ncbi:ATPase, AAA-type, core [Acididesulfobacillus acetoxydans]|uniref:ATPase, AAA-type, core n=1 Tax=Acididesulfobacillus acetoxydans TaxID=1561005 RepID=A0A8S0Y3M7_9FIRM|nr:ATPase, AAA-type, core [Acididesulfobacillus acetoxydans]CEJ07557.1 P-loop containing nucleoside triphosphate hydrolase [Acididesulfobacillus acetoxydans]
MSLIGKPRLIFLDEPTTGLDPEGRIEVWKVVKELANGGTTVFLTTQYLEEGLSAMIFGSRSLGVLAFLLSRIYSQ